MVLVQISNLFFTGVQGREAKKRSCSDVVCFCSVSSCCCGDYRFALVCVCVCMFLFFFVFLFFLRPSLGYIVRRLLERMRVSLGSLSVRRVFAFRVSSLFTLAEMAGWPLSFSLRLLLLYSSLLHLCFFSFCVGVTMSRPAALEELKADDSRRQKAKPCTRPGSASQ